MYLFLKFKYKLEYKNISVKLDRKVMNKRKY